MVHLYIRSLSCSSLAQLETVDLSLDKTVFIFFTSKQIIMNAFQIVDKDNNPVPINELDKQAAEFWDVELRSRSYACPTINNTNWYDSIGWKIANPGRYATGWTQVKMDLLRLHLEDVAYALVSHTKPLSYEEILNSWKPYFDLIDHWASLGYQPKQIVQ